jgi:hypothetical protein
MKLDSVFSVLVLCDILLEIASFAGADGTPSRGLLLDTLWLAVVATTIVGWIGLAWRIREGRVIYLASWIGYLVLLALGGPITSTAGGYMLEMLMSLVGGAVIAVAWFSDLGASFRPLLPSAS